MNGHLRLPIRPTLAEHVEGVWVQHDAAGPRTAPPQPYTVLPTPHPVVGFQYRGRRPSCGTKVPGSSGVVALPASRASRDASEAHTTPARSS